LPVELKKIKKIRQDFAVLLLHCVTASDVSESSGKSFLLWFSPDLTQSVKSSEVLIEKGLRNPARRELRFVLESSVKTLFVDQSLASAPFESREKFFESNRVDSNSIDEANELELSLLDSRDSKACKEKIREEWGWASSYVHPSTHQVKERLEMQVWGRHGGDIEAQYVRKYAEEFFEIIGLVSVLVLEMIDTRSELTAADVISSLTDPPGWILRRHRFVGKIGEQFDDQLGRDEAQLERLKQERQKTLFE
jgi:nucleoside diphosphate kinase